MSQRTCLVVDDSTVVRKAARRIIEGFGFSVSEAKDGQEALDACRSALPEAVLLDWNMPVMTRLDMPGRWEAIFAQLGGRTAAREG